MTSFKSRVSIFSFIMTVLVIWIHAVNAELTGLSAPEAEKDFGSACFYIQKILGSGLGQTAVPGFFSMSGYLFFRNAGENESISFFTAKWKKRIRSLILPFLIWNLIYYVIYILTGRASVNVSLAISSIFLNRYNPVFWYLRELIILTFLTPAIYLFTKKKNTGFIILAACFAAAVFYDSIPVHIVNEDALFYYMTGAFLAMHYKGFIEASDNQGSSRASADETMTEIKCSGKTIRHGYAGWIYIFVVCLTAFIIFEYIYVFGAGHLRAVLTGAVGGRTAGYMLIFALISCVGGFKNKTRAKTETEKGTLPFFMSFNFLIYALHYLEIRFFRMIFAQIGIDRAVTESAGFIIMPVLCIAAAAMCGSIMMKYTPKLYKALTGGRG